jgi:hypothetical protein
MNKVRDRKEMDNMARSPPKKIKKNFEKSVDKSNQRCYNNNSG